MTRPICPPPDPDRPISAAVSAGIALLIGVVGVYATFVDLAWRPHAAFPVPKYAAVTAACGAVALVGVGLMVGLLAGRLGGWLAAVTWALIAGVLPALRLGEWLRGGNPLADTLRRDPSLTALIVLAAILMSLLWRPATRHWYAAMHRSRAAWREVGRDALLGRRP